MVLWLWSWTFSGSKIFKRRIIWSFTFSTSGQMTELDSSFRRRRKCGRVVFSTFPSSWLSLSNGRSFYELTKLTFYESTLEHTRWSRKYSCCLTGNQRKPFNKGVMWSNFPAPLTILEAKFCTAWTLFRLNWLVLLQTEEQQNSLLNTNTLMIIIKAFLSKKMLNAIDLA